MRSWSILLSFKSERGLLQGDQILYTPFILLYSIAALRPLQKPQVSFIYLVSSPLLRILKSILPETLSLDLFPPHSKS